MIIQITLKIHPTPITPRELNYTSSVVLIVILLNKLKAVYVSQIQLQIKEKPFCIYLWCC